MNQVISSLKYPIGEFVLQSDLNQGQRKLLIESLALVPLETQKSIEDLSEEQLAMPYRPGGWTVRQVVHHLADASIHGYVRWRLALTEPNPVTLLYKEEAWAILEDASKAPVNWSIQLMEALYARWILLLRSLQDEDFQRTFIHPKRGSLSLDHALQLYAWHGKHHVAHIVQLRARLDW